MSFPEIKREEVEKLKKYVNQEVILIEWTSSYIDPVFAPKGEVTHRDDWDQYGGYPGFTPESIVNFKIVLIAIFGRLEKGKFILEYIVGKEDRKLKFILIALGLSHGSMLYGTKTNFCGGQVEVL